MRKRTEISIHKTTCTVALDISFLCQNCRLSWSRTPNRLRGVSSGDSGLCDPRQATAWKHEPSGKD